MKSFSPCYLCLALGVLLFFLSANSCSDAGVDPNKSNFTGITVTNESGQVLSVDPGDWSCGDTLVWPDSADSIIHGLPIKFCFGPAYPNPTEGNVNIAFDFPFASHARIIVFDGGSFVDTIFEQQLASGSHLFQWNGESLPKKIYRFTISTADWQSYGDVEFR